MRCAEHWNECPNKNAAALHTVCEAQLIAGYCGVTHYPLAPVCDGYDIPAYLHPADSGMLSDPARWHGPQLAPLIAGVRLPDPSDVQPLDDGAPRLVGEVVLRILGDERAQVGDTFVPLAGGNARVALEVQRLGNVLGLGIALGIAAQQADGEIGQVRQPLLRP